jgi:FkbM family methyltransferase
MGVIESYSSLLGDYRHVFGRAGLAYAIRARTANPGVATAVPPRATHPVTLRLGTTDIATYLDVFVKQPYKVDLRTPPRVIVDAGANIGLTSVYFALRYPEARIIAVEPEGTNAALLAVNTAPYPNVTVVAAALWHDETTVNVVDSGRGHWGFRTTGDERHAMQRVPAVTVDSLIRKHGIDYIDVLKVDIEGAEAEVFADASAWIDRVGLILIELHERFRPGCNRVFYQATRGFDIDGFARGHNVGVAREGMLAGPLRKAVPIRKA